ncbi:IgGFc-binding protein-like [Leptodactylus fuscus]|uniref:IgGFc-binding protein-like isoform X1 n=1 Tax=Leptodactylus fuscus TaxID=238119 RepID=UPI003F4EB2B5
MILLICTIWSLFQDVSSADDLSSSSSKLTGKCDLKPGREQRRFVMVFMKNIQVSSATTLQLYLVTCDKAATVSVTVSRPYFNKTIHVDKDSSSLVTLDYTYMITESDITSKVILITSDVAISVFAFYTAGHSADATACLPEEDLGQEYYIFTPKLSTGQEFAIANGFETIAHVNVTVSGTITYKGITYNTGRVLSLSLKQQEVIQFVGSVDLTGTKISSSAPVAVFTGHVCYSGAGCDTLVEQLHPVQNWGTFFAVFPFFTHTKDVIDIMAASPDTIVSIDSPKGTSHHNLTAGVHVELTVDNIMLINSSKPIMVSYLSQESKSSAVSYSYDPFLLSVPSSLFGRRYYKFVTHSFYDSFIFIVSQASSDVGFYLDGKPLSSYPTTTKEFNGFRGWQVTLGKTEGHHEIYHETSTFTFYVFGTESYASYGYSVGQELPPADPECSIRCLPDSAEYILPYSLLSEAHLDVLDFHLEDPLCRAEKEKDHYLIKIPYNRCGSSVLYEDERTFYANTIYGTIPDTDVHRIEIPVRCDMEGNKTLGLIFNPKVTDVICKGSYNVSMRLYQSESFTEPVTLYPYEADLHSNLHVELKVESEDEELQIFIETLMASPSLQDTKKKYKVIQHGCRKDSTLQVLPTLDHRRQRLNFHAFKFDHFHEVYLTGNVIICHNGTSPNRCTKGCITTRQRRDVRSLKDEEVVGSDILSLGPIVLQSREKSEAGGYNVPLSIFSTTICVIGILAAGLVAQRYYYRRRQNLHTKNASN